MKEMSVIFVPCDKSSEVLQPANGAFDAPASSIVSITQQIDLSGAVGRMVASVMFGLAEIELEYRRERQAAGIKVAKSRGVYTGRRPGTTKGKPKRALELRNRGLQVSEIAKALYVSERTVFRYLNNE